MKKLLSTFLMVAVALNMHAQTCFPTDNNFGINGVSTGFTISNWTQHANTVVLPDNKILQFSSNNVNGFVATKFKVNGGLDSTFGVNGKATIFSGPGNGLHVGAVQSDGKILLAGTVSGSVLRMAIARLNSNGSVDIGFGVNGMVVTSITPQHEEAYGLAIQPDGKILVAGSSSGNCFLDCNGYTFCRRLLTVLRLQVNGNYDSTFGQNGKVIFGVGSFNSGVANSVVVQPDGKIVVAGESHEYYCDDYYGGGSWYSGFVMTRLNSNGTFDASFGQNGLVRDTIGLMNTVRFIMQADGKFVVLGYSYNNGAGYLVRRYNSNGTLDNSFHQNFFNYPMSAMSLSPDGKIVVAGQLTNSSQQDVFVARLKADGHFDSSFNVDGKMVFNIGPTAVTSDMITGIAFQGNQVILGGGTTTNAPFVYNQVVVRLSDPVTGLLVQITPSGTLYPCAGSGVTLTTNQQGSHQWYLNGQILNGASNQSYYATNTGNYTARVTNASNCGISTPVYVGINALPINVVPNSSTFICLGDSVKLVTNAQKPVQWYLNSVPINGATDSVIWAKIHGNYHVSVNNASGCGTSGSVFVNITPAKPPVNWTGTILATSGGFSGYQWYLNGNLIPTATQPHYTPATPGSYKVNISNFPCAKMSDEFNLSCNIINVPKPTISWSGAQLSVPNSYNTYQWFLNNNPIQNANAYYVYINQTGVYRINVTGLLGCTVASNDFVLTCNEAGPAKPPINWNGAQFTTNTGYSNYQWFHNDTAITGANSFAYTPVTSKYGRYKVEVANAFNCTRFSDERYYAPTDIVTLGQVKFTYYPNPVKGTFYIDVLQASLKTMRAVVYDLNGKKLIDQNLRQGQNQIEVKGLSAGLYHLEISFGNEKSSVKLSVLQ